MKRLIGRIVQAAPDDIGEQTMESAKKVLLDTLGSLILGMKEASIQNLLAPYKLFGPGPYAVLGTDVRLDLFSAAFVNGTASVAVELDEGNQWSKGHPAAHVVPAMLTYVQTKQQYDGRLFLSNLIKSYELCSYFGRATTLQPEAHAHGTWGVSGAAGSILLMDQVGEESLQEGLQISASFAMPTRWTAALEGSPLRNVYAGQAAESGIKTAALLQAGYRAPNQNIEYVFGQIIGQAFQPDCMSGVMDGWDIDRNYFKSHAFCRYAHAPLEAFQAIVQEHGIRPEDIRKIDVFTYQRAATLNSSQYHNALSAKFSIPFALSSWLYTDSSAHSIFNEDVLQNSVIRDLAEKVEVRASAALEVDYPTIMPAEVVVFLNTGEVFKKRLDNALGGPEEVYSLSHIIHKFKENSNGTYAEDRQEEIVDWIVNMENKQNMKELIDLVCL
ncbi:MmgE/PrpD family protein [Sporosarcina sp. FSL W7-1349]|uniref:MmgE/PrpD family protein n=1 Tax=Sporosarcina sp. FSL W7-1349 TaxID=2921561 RepID=UPI0030F595EE